jgi:hypothetical protein
MKNQSKDVAFATVVSCDPTQKIGGVQLGKEFLMVRVSIALAQDELLVRPYKNYKVIGDVTGASIAWPSTFVRCYPVASLNFIYPKYHINIILQFSL